MVLALHHRRLRRRATTSIASGTQAHASGVAPPRLISQPQPSSPPAGVVPVPPVAPPLLPPRPA
jgi:hypothetical protein